MHSDQRKKLVQAILDIRATRRKSAKTAQRRTIIAMILSGILLAVAFVADVFAPAALSHSLLYHVAVVLLAFFMPYSANARFHLSHNSAHASDRAVLTKARFPSGGAHPIGQPEFSNVELVELEYDAKNQGAKEAVAVRRKDWRQELLYRAGKGDNENPVAKRLFAVFPEMEAKVLEFANLLSKRSPTLEIHYAGRAESFTTQSTGRSTGAFTIVHPRFGAEDVQVIYVSRYNVAGLLHEGLQFVGVDHTLAMAMEALMEGVHAEMREVTLETSNAKVTIAIPRRALEMTWTPAELKKFIDDYPAVQVEIANHFGGEDQQAQRNYLLALAQVLHEQALAELRKNLRISTINDKVIPSSPRNTLHSIFVLEIVTGFLGILHAALPLLSTRTLHIMGKIVYTVHAAVSPTPIVTLLLIAALAWATHSLWRQAWKDFSHGWNRRVLAMDMAHFAVAAEASTSGNSFYVADDFLTDAKNQQSAITAQKSIGLSA
jgi:hypothetical protein